MVLPSEVSRYPSISRNFTHKFLIHLHRLFKANKIGDTDYLFPNYVRYVKGISPSSSFLTLNITEHVDVKRVFLHLN